MFVYALAQPIDFFDGLIPLPRWIAEDPGSNTAWALRATLALADARARPAGQAACATCPPSEPFRSPVRPSSSW